MVKIMENPIKMDDLGVPLFLETPTLENWHVEPKVLEVWFKWISFSILMIFRVFNGFYSTDK